MRAGFSERDITPEPGIDLCGYLARVQPSIGVHDKLYAKALFAESGKDRFIWVHCDLVGFNNIIASNIRGKISANTGIEVKNIMLSATHTHSGPATVYLRNCGTIDENYLNFLEKSIMTAVADASSSLQDVSLHFTETEIDNVCIDRTRSKNYSHVDKRLPLLAFKRADGSFAAIITNLALHNVALTGENRYISGDMAGFAAEKLSMSIPGRPLIFFTNGACGNINPAVQSADFSAVEKQGTEISETILRAIPKLKPCGNEEIKTSFSEIELPLDIPSKEEIEKAFQAHLDYYAANPKNYVNDRLIDTYREWAKSAIDLTERKNPADMKSQCYIHLLRIGNYKFAGINAEVFSHMADNIRAAAKDNDFYILGYTDGCIGYMAPESVYPENGYATGGAYKFYSNFALKTGGFEEVEKRILKDLQNL